MPKLLCDWSRENTRLDNLICYRTFPDNVCCRYITIYHWSLQFLSCIYFLSIHYNLLLKSTIIIIYLFILDIIQFIFKVCNHYHVFIYFRYIMSRFHQRTRWNKKSFDWLNNSFLSRHCSVSRSRKSHDFTAHRRIKNGGRDISAPPFRRCRLGVADSALDNSAPCRFGTGHFSAVS